MKNEGALPVVDVRIEDPGLIPGGYFLEKEVLDALENVIRTDVVINGKPVPTGARPVYGPDLLASKQKLAQKNLVRVIKKESWSFFVFAILTGVAMGITILLMEGAGLIRG